eukprot:TRINITY_DN18102_c0_g1_i1.p1 TRINITY_DN18102_c0_g1~~TRINITY_DN18102_c0_g1_i1.p1  ORF type:complete len:292 (+),score=107.62 TRINITY_DN18102_c0_g1_i1:26-877(+)
MAEEQPTADITVFNPSFAKKKKKKASAPAASPAPEVPVAAPPATPEQDAAAPAPAEAAAPAMAFDFGGKKRKKKVADAEAAAPSPVAAPEAEAAAPTTEVESIEGQGQGQGQGVAPWLESDRDYTYDELCTRIFEMLQCNNPEYGTRHKRFAMKPPQVCREGTKKSVWINFAEMCNIMHRKTEHVMAYVFAELGTHGSLDGSQRLVIRGRYQPKQIETITRNYIEEYVFCKTCHQADTTLKKENRVTFVCCNQCGSSRSVAQIKKGFEAQIGKRKLQRFKTQT